MFEYKIDFLMGPKQTADDQAELSAFCFASKTAERQLAELADLVGSGSTLSSNPQIDLVDEAPALEFDLEGELSKAFGGADEAPAPTPIHSDGLASAQQPDATQNSIFDTAALETALSQGERHDGSLAANPEPTHSDEPVLDEMFDEDALSESLAAELDKALAKEVELDFAQEATEVAPEQNAAASQEQFDIELARLMGTETNQPATPQPVAPAPAPEVAMEPWNSPEIMQAAEVPASEPVENIPDPVDKWTPPQTSDFAASSVDYSDPAVDYSDPAAELSAPTVAPELDIDAALSQAVAETEAESTAENKSIPAANTAPYYDTAPAVEPVSDNGFDQHDDGVVVPPAAIASSAMMKRRSGRKAAFAIVAVALLGGTAALGWNIMGGETGPAPTLLASSDPVKVKPKDAGGKVVPNQDQAVYQSVDGTDPNKPAQKRLKDSTEKPINVAISETVKKTNSRAPKSDDVANAGIPLKPRRVRTVVVKPDGTIVSSTKAVANETTTSGVTIENPTLALQPTNNAQVTLGKENTTKAVSFNLPKPAAETAELALAEPKVETPAVKPAEVKTVAVEPVKKPVAVKKPVKKVKPKPAVEKLASVSSPYAVQVASQRSAAAANKSYANLSKRYARIIGGKGVDIKKVKISGKGTYYRVRIPAQSRSAANTICSRLKSAGGDCFVTR